MSDERGPSYWDVAELAADLRARTGLLADFQVLPPVQVDATGRKTAWQVVARLRDASGRLSSHGEAHTQYGSGGAWRTFPAAMHAALSDLWARVNRTEEEAKRRAAF